MAATAMVSRRVGEKKFKQASLTASQAILVTLIVTVIISSAGFLFAEEILRLMGATQEVISSGKNYTKIIFASNGAIMLIFLINGIFRGAGNAAIAMRALWISNILNMLLDPVFIFGLGPIPEMGVTGAAVATTIGRSTGVLYQLFHLLSGRKIIKISVKYFKPHFELIQRVIKIASGGVGQFLIESASWIFITRIVSDFGSEALAGYTIALRIIIFTILPSFGVANAAATLVGQNLGAKQPERAEKSVWIAARFNMVFLFSISVLFFVFANEIVSIFSEEQNVAGEAIKAIRMICLGYIFFAYGMVISQSFNGAGDTKTPTFINLFCFWLVQIPLSYFLSNYTSLDTYGIYIAIISSFGLLAGCSIWLFKKGKWKEMEV
jgi:putative MATE family efflux protein